VEPSTEEFIQKLHGEDPWNNDGAYTHLGEALMLAKDLQNAVVALGIAIMNTNELVAQSQVIGAGGDFDRASSQSTEKMAGVKSASTGQLRRCDRIWDLPRVTSPKIGAVIYLGRHGFVETACCCSRYKTAMLGGP
jgi:hypothetical protein